MFRRIVTCLLTIALVWSGFPGGPRRAHADSPGLDAPAAVRGLQAYGILDHRPLSELRLGDPISRAEVAKVLGAALKLQAEEQKNRDLPAFPDTAGHWANGWIAASRERGLFLGREGRFYPGDSVTYAELLTALLRMVGRGQQAATDWPWGAISTAASVGMIPADMDLGGQWQKPASRGDVFRLVALGLGRVPLPGTGQTLLQNVHDRVPPALVLSGFPKSTGERTLMVSGQAGDAVVVTVAGVAAELSWDGRFSTLVTLQRGENLLPVVAVDGAGNRAEAEARLIYQLLARVEISPTFVETAVGQSFAMSVRQVDTAGGAQVVDGAAWSYDPTGLVQDPTTGVFRALKPGEYSLRGMVSGLEATARVVVSGAAARLDVTVERSTLAVGGLPTAARVRVLDQQGRLNTAGTYQVQMSIVPSGAATLDKTTVTTQGGEALVYLAPGSTLGGFGIQAKLPGSRELLSPLVAVSVEPRRWAGVQLNASPANVVPSDGQSVTVVAVAVDQSGAPITVTEDVQVRLTTADTGIARIVDASVVIRAGTASSEFGGQNGRLVTVGGTGGAEISGVVARNGNSGAPKEVQPVTITADNTGPLVGLAVRVERDAALADELTAALVAVARVDRDGRVVADDRTPVVLLTRTVGVGVAQIEDAGGIVTFAVRSATAGRVVLAAGVPGRPALNSPSAEVAFMQAGVTARPVVRVTPQRVTAGDTAAVYVALETASGGAVSNPGPPLFFELQATGATLATTSVAIPTGATRTAEVRLTVPAMAKSVTVTAATLGGKVLSPAQVTVAAPPSAQTPPIPAGLNLAATVAAPGRNPAAGEETLVKIQARSGSSLRSGAQAFGLRVKLNGRELTEFPSNLQVTLGRYSVKNIDLRTSQGEADLWVRYTGAGVLEIEPLAVAAVSQAFDQWGVAGYGEATSGSSATKATLTYVAGPLSRLAVKLEPNLGGSLQAGIRAAKGRYATIAVTPADSHGNPAGTACEATLTRVRATPADTVLIRSGNTEVAQLSMPVAQNGSATFLVTATASVEERSEWLPAAVCGSMVLTLDETVRINATLAEAVDPVIEVAGGDWSGDGYVVATDTVLKVTLAYDRLAAPLAEVLVYDSDTLVGRFGPVRLNSTDASHRSVRIPKSALGATARSIAIQVRVNTGADVSDPSAVRYISYSP